AAMAALYSGFVLAEGTVVLDAALKTAVITVILVGVNFAWLFAGAALTRLFRQPRANRAINIAFAAALLLSVAAVLMLWEVGTRAGAAGGRGRGRCRCDGRGGACAR